MKHTASAVLNGDLKQGRSILSAQDGIRDKSLWTAEAHEPEEVK